MRVIITEDNYFERMRLVSFVEKYNKDYEIVCFEKYGETIKSEVLADAITAGNLAGYEKEWNINGEKVTISVEKV